MTNVAIGCIRKDVLTEYRRIWKVSSPSTIDEKWGEYENNEAETHLLPVWMTLILCFANYLLKILPLSTT